MTRSRVVLTDELQDEMWVELTFLCTVLEP